MSRQLVTILCMRCHPPGYWRQTPPETYDGGLRLTSPLWPCPGGPVVPHWPRRHDDVSLGPCGRGHVPNRSAQTVHSATKANTIKISLDLSNFNLHHSHASTNLHNQTFQCPWFHIGFMSLSTYIQYLPSKKRATGSLYLQSAISPPSVWVDVPDIH